MQPKAKPLIFSQAWERGKSENREFFFFYVMLLSVADLLSEALVFTYRGEI